MQIKKILDVYKALSDETRLRIINLLVNRGEICVCDLMKVLEIAQGRISSHLKILRASGLVIDRREGLWILYSIPAKVQPTYQIQIDGFKNDLKSTSPFKDDLKKFDKLRKNNILAQCQSSTCCVK